MAWTGSTGVLGAGTHRAVASGGTHLSGHGRMLVLHYALVTVVVHAHEAEKAEEADEEDHEEQDYEEGVVFAPGVRLSCAVSVEAAKLLIRRIIFWCNLIAILVN